MTAPAVFPALAVIAGIAIGVFAPSLTRVALLLLPTAVVIAAAAWKLRRGTTVAILAVLGFTSAGVILGAAQLAAGARPPVREFFDDARAKADGALPPITVEGVIRQDATPTAYGASMTVDVVRVQTTCGWLPAPGGLRVAIIGDLAHGRVDGWIAGRRARLPVLLRLPTSFRDPGVPDEAFAMMRRGIGLAGTVKSAALVEIVRRGNPLAESAGRARAYTRQAMAAAISDRPRASAIVTAILVGDRGGLDAESERRLQEAGTYHVIAISGGNVAILAGLGMVLLRFAKVPTRVGSLVLAFVICVYGYVAGGGASVARATIAAAVYFVATAADHRSPALNVLATVALVAVLYDPLAAFDPGLLLSYGATLSLLIGAERSLRARAESRRQSGGEGEACEDAASAVSAPLRRWGTSASSASRYVRSGATAVLVGTVAAEIALLPIGASIFHRITLAGIVLNFIAIPLMTVAQIGGIAVLLLHPISATFAGMAGSLAGLAADGLVRSTVLLDLAPWLTWRVPAPPIALTAVYYAGWSLVLIAGRLRRLRIAAVAASASAALLIAWPALAEHVLVRRSPPPGQLKVTFLDVGQGDSMLVQFPNGASMLVDAAGLAGSAFDLGERVITPTMLALGVRRLDYLVVTHGDPDHVEGAPSIARDFRPRELWEGVPVPPHQTLQRLEAVVAHGRGITRLARTDDHVRAGPVELRVLYPPEPDWERQRVRNDDSIVMELRYGDVSIVLPGDIGSGVEESIAGRLSDAPVRILKAAHHGSATSSSDAWLSATHPAAVIFSCGRENRYGHPAPVVLERVKAHGAAVFRTDLDGAVTVTTDGRSAQLTTFTGRTSLLTPAAVTDDHKGH